MTILTATSWWYSGLVTVTVLLIYLAILLLAYLIFVILLRSFEWFGRWCAYQMLQREYPAMKRGKKDDYSKF